MQWLRLLMRRAHRGRRRPNSGADPMPEPKPAWQPGDLVRFDQGKTDIARLVAPVAGGWRAVKCRGGYTFVYDRRWGERAFRHPSSSDIEVWTSSANHRRPLDRDSDRRA